MPDSESVFALSRRDAADYLSSMIPQMREIARHGGFDLLDYLLAMAADEAREQMEIIEP